MQWRDQKLKTVSSSKKNLDPLTRSALYGRMRAVLDDLEVIDGGDDGGDDGDE